MPKAKWREILDASKAEAVLAVDLYNRAATSRSLEGFYVHMHLAWLYLFQAQFRRGNIDFFYRDSKDPRRYQRINGERRTWDLQRCVNWRWPNLTPEKANLEYSILLRNKIEHRYESALASLTAGHAQALVKNYDWELCCQFGSEHSLAHVLRFPLFLSTFAENNYKTAQELRQRIPKRTWELLSKFESALDPVISEDPRFEFRIKLQQVVGPKSTADMALRFVQLDDLGELDQIDVTSGSVIVRDKHVPVSNLDLHRPSVATKRIAQAHPFQFNAWHFTRTWKYFCVRPNSGDSNPERTDSRYCVYDQSHSDYLYTNAFVEKVLRETDTPEKYAQVFGKTPKRQKMATDQPPLLAPAQ